VVDIKAGQEGLDKASAKFEGVRKALADIKEARSQDADAYVVTGLGAGRNLRGPRRMPNVWPTRPPGGFSP
jgi:hypothetical protein